MRSIRVRLRVARRAVSATLGNPTRGSGEEAYACLRTRRTQPARLSPAAARPRTVAGSGTGVRFRYTLPGPTLSPVTEYVNAAPPVSPEASNWVELVMLKRDWSPVPVAIRYE